MYSGFIEDRLAQNSEYIKLLKQGIDIFKPVWMDDNFRAKIKYDNFSLIDSFFSNVKAEYNDTEKLFLYHSIYSQAGFEEALENLSFFVTGLKIEVDKVNVSYRPMIEFKRYQTSSLFYYESLWPYISDSNRKFFYLNNDEYLNISLDRNNFDQPFTVQYSNYQTTELSATLIAKPEDVSNNYILFDSNPYIDSIIPEGSFVQIYNLNTLIDTVVIPINSSGTIVSGNNSIIKLEKDETTSTIINNPMWRLIVPNTYTVNRINYQQNKPLNLKIRVTQDEWPQNQFIEILLQSSTTFAELDAHAILQSNGKYYFDFNPYISNDSSQYPADKSGTEGVYSYNVNVSTTTELFYDTDLAKSQINELIRELLFYYTNKTPELNIKFLTFDNNVVNKRYNDLIISARKYYYLTL